MSRGRKAWQHSRIRKTVKPHLRVTKKGVEFIKSFLHEYPHKDELKLKDRDRLKPRKEKSKRKRKALEEAKDRMACMLGF